MNLTHKFRNNSVLLSNEVYTYLASMAKALVEGTEAATTVDQFADNYLREKITTEHPDLVEMYAQLETKKQQARRDYKAIEERMAEAISGRKGVKQAA